jgi:hypothetical protein
MLFQLFSSHCLYLFLLFFKNLPLFSVEKGKTLFGTRQSAEEAADGGEF